MAKLASGTCLGLLSTPFDYSNAVSLEHALQPHRHSALLSALRSESSLTIEALLQSIKTIQIENDAKAVLNRIAKELDESTTFKPWSPNRHHLESLLKSNEYIGEPYYSFRRHGNLKAELISHFVSTGNLLILKTLPFELKLEVIATFKSLDVHDSIYTWVKQFENRMGSRWTVADERLAQEESKRVENKQVTETGKKSRRKRVRTSDSDSHYVKNGDGSYSRFVEKAELEDSPECSQAPGTINQHYKLSTQQNSFANRTNILPAIGDLTSLSLPNFSPVQQQTTNPQPTLKWPEFSQFHPYQSSSSPPTSPTMYLERQYRETISQQPRPRPQVYERRYDGENLLDPFTSVDDDSRWPDFTDELLAQFPC